MQIASILVCQRNLKRDFQIPELVHALLREDAVPPIELVACEDGYAVHNGHHRLTAYALAGFQELPEWAYVIRPFEARATFGTIQGLVERYKKSHPMVALAKETKVTNSVR